MNENLKLGPAPIDGLPPISEIRLTPSYKLAACETYQDALRLAMTEARMSRQEICQRLPISKGQLSKVLGGSKQLTRKQEIRWMRLCRSAAPQEFQALQINFDLTPHVLTTEEKAALWEAQQA